MSALSAVGLFAESTSVPLLACVLLPLSLVHSSSLRLTKTVYLNRRFGDLPAKSTVYAPYICTELFSSFFWKQGFNKVRGSS